MHSLCLLFRTEGAVRRYCGFFYCYKQYETVLSGFAPFPAGRFRGLLTASIPFFLYTNAAFAFVSRCSVPTLTELLKAYVLPDTQTTSMRRF